MIGRTSAVLGMALLAACGTSGQGDGQTRAAVATAAVKPLDVAGVKLGMGVAEAKAALRAAGWRTEDVTGPDWNQAIEREVGKRKYGVWMYQGRAEGVASITGTKGDEFVSIQFDPTVDGERVKSASYSAPAAGRSFADFKAELARRYGFAVLGAARGVNAQSGIYQPRGRNGFKLTYGLDAGRVALSLDRGADADAAWQAGVKRAAATKAGPVGKSF